ncbi:MAG: hypothetical protein Ctma_0870 [Catillopecten margaritatus gill symbiont]|uniref:Pentapeptide repeat-containing protein n=1 Tax=Catillopecten margaritatus gill symbiont TaxID=3083288 RepID=A0AAU6PGL4_9GAMM
MRDAQLQGANLRDAQLQGANLRDAQLQGADLRDAQLQGANLRDAQLQGADLRDAQLQGANLWDAQLQGANLWDAQLQGADLRDAQLQGAYISNKGLEFLNFEQQIAQQIGKETTTEALEKQYKALDETQKSQLIQALKAVKSQNTDAAIQRIESASETLNLSKATTGAYSQEEADKWLNDYKEQNK